MKKKILLLLVAIVVSATIYAQKRIYFCDDYTQAGEPVGTSNVWSIKPTGGNVYMLYKNDGVNITTSSIYVYIDKLTGSDYKEFATKTLVPDKYKSWVIYDFKFTEAGEYKVSFLDASSNPLATEYATIKVKEEVASTASAASTKLTSDYYTEAKVVFCESVDDNGSAVTASSEFNISRSDGGYTYVLIDHIKPLKTTELIVDIWKGDDYKDFVETKRFTVEEPWQWTDFKYSFTTAGKYKFMVYNKDEVFVQSGYVVIKYK